MLTKKTTIKKKPMARENILDTITSKLDTVLPLVKEQLGKKKFKKRIKKVAKLLIAGIKEINLKKPGSAVKKATTLKTAAK